MCPRLDLLTICSKPLVDKVLDNYKDSTQYLSDAHQFKPNAIIDKTAGFIACCFYLNLNNRLFMEPLL